jgi:hypothetical protein
MQSFWDMLPASLWPTQPFIPPEEGASALQALRAMQLPANSSSPVTTGPNNLAGVQGGSLGALFGGAAGAPRATSFWDLLPPALPGRPFVSVLPTPGQLDPRLAAAPAAGVAQPFASGPLTVMDQATNSSGILGPALTRSVLGDDQLAATRQLATGGAQAAPPASIGGLGTRLPAIGAAAVRPLTDYLPTQGQYAREGVDEMREGWRNLTTRHPDEMTNHMGVSLSNLKGIAQMGLGAAGYLGSPINAAIHTIIGQPIEDATGLPSKYTDFAAGLALPFVKRLPGMSAPPAAAARVPAATAAAGVDVAKPVDLARRPQLADDAAPAGAKLGSQARELSFAEDNRRILYGRNRNILEQIDPSNPKLQTDHPADWIPSLQDIKVLNDEIAVVRERNGLWDLVNHHNFLGADKFRPIFKAAGIDPDDYMTYMWARDHIALDRGSNNWTAQWRASLRALKGTDSDMMHEQLNKMLKK